MEELRYILRFVHGLLSHTEETWNYLTDPNTKEGQSEYMMRGYYLPLMGVGALLIFILHGNGVMLHSKLPFDAPFSFEYAMKGTVAFALSYAIGPTFARLVIEQIFCRVTHIMFDKSRLEIFVHYSMSIVMLVDMFCACLPNFTFLSFIGLYVIYVVFLGTDVYLKLKEARGYFLTVSFLSIYFCPWLIERILTFFAK